MSAFVLWLLIIGVGACGTDSKERTYNLRKGSLKGAWDVFDRAARLGLRASEHIVRTEDGYLLRAFRVHGTGTRAGLPVLLMHGLLQSAAGWLDAGYDSLASLFATAGYDLWLGNARGSHYSRRHTWFRPDTDALFWQFNADEIGRLDLPALIDYILDFTNNNKLNYIGFSQGGGVFYVMCSERPVYCNKVNLMIGLAPATRMLHTTSVFFRIITEFYEHNEEKLNKIDIWEALPQGSLVQVLLKNLCNLSDAIAEACIVFKDLLDGSNPGSIRADAYRANTASSLAGTSVHNMAWFGQLVKSDHFRKFDYGSKQNLVYYGNETAPMYNFSAVTVPTVVMYGRNDGIVDERDVKWLIKELPNVKRVIEIEDPLWTHLDFCLSKNIPKFLFPKIEEVLNGNI